jgi:hypothetical protein
MTGQPESRYLITELPDGFRVEGKDRCPVEVKLDSYGFCTQRHRHGHFTLDVLLTDIGRQVIAEWTPPDPNRKPFPGMHHWIVKQIVKVIAKRVRFQWAAQRVLGQWGAEAVKEWPAAENVPDPFPALAF